MYITPVIISQTQFINGKIGISKSLTLLFNPKIDIGPSWYNTPLNPLPIKYPPTFVLPHKWGEDMEGGREGSFWNLFFNL